MKHLICLIGILFFNTACAQAVKEVRYAILVPMEDESIQLLENIKNKHYKVIDGVHYIEGVLNNVPMVFANTGLGKTNVSLITSRLIHDYHPKYIFLAGSSGNINANLKNHPVVIGERVIDADLGTLTEQGPNYPLEEYFSTPQKNNLLIPKFYTPSSQLFKVAKQLIERMEQNKVLFGSIATSDVLPNPPEQTELLKRNKIDAVEMEGSSFMQACWLFDQNCMVIRGISNNVDEEITKEDTIQAGNDATLAVGNIIELLEQS